MKTTEFLTEQIAKFDALPEKPTHVTLTEYRTPEEWGRAPEQICSFEQQAEINRLLKSELERRGVIVSFKRRGKLELAFTVKQTPTPGIGWVVLEREKNNE